MKLNRNTKKHKVLLRDFTTAKLTLWNNAMFRVQPQREMPIMIVCASMLIWVVGGFALSLLILCHLPVVGFIATKKQVTLS